MEFMRRFEFLKTMARSVLHLELQDAKITLYTERQKARYWQREHDKVLSRYENLLKDVGLRDTHSGNML